MKRFLLAITACLTLSFSSKATVHTGQVWDGYFQFVGSPTMELGDTIQWLPLDPPMMVHTITSTTIPAGAATFDYIWQAPADTFFFYVPTEIGVYNYECTPHATSHNMVGSFEVVPATNVPVLPDVSLRVYPNPAANTVLIKNLGFNTNYQIVSVTGSTAMKGMYNGPIDVSELPAGIYFIRFEGYESKAIRFMKQ